MTTDEKIMQAAKSLFTKYGFKKVSMDEIALNADVTKKTVYSYFSSKEELLKSCIKKELTNMKNIVDTEEEKDQDFMEKVHHIIYNLLKYKNNSRFLSILVKESEIFNNKKLKDNLDIINTEIQSYIKHLLSVAVEKEHLEISNIDIMTFLIYKMYLALMIDWNESYGKLDEKEIADILLQIFRGGLKRKEVD